MGSVVHWWAMTTSRTYTMRARATAVERTRTRILQAAFELADDKLLSDISLDDVARRAGVSVQTVLRHYGSRSALFSAASEYAAAIVAAERRAPAGDVTEALRLLVEHYERRGDATVLLLAQEARDPVVRGVVERGRQVHRAWVEETFGGSLRQRGAAQVERETALQLLGVVTDVYTWKQLRRDGGLSPSDTRTRITSLVTAVMATATCPKEH